jgi:hypothetical protein
MYRINYGTDENPAWRLVEHIVANGEQFVYKVENEIKICRKKLK